MALHFMILYVPFFRALFQITPLNWQEWQAVLWISAPVIAIDEVLKWVSNRLSKSVRCPVITKGSADEIADSQVQAVEEKELSTKKDQ
jgi:hypothetical protein